MANAALPTLLAGFVGTRLPSWVQGRLKHGMGGVLIFPENIQSPGQLQELSDAIYAANPHAVIAIDEEGGDVTRLYAREGSPFAGNAVLGRLDDVALTQRVGEHIGWELRRAGIGLVFGPVADVNSNPNNPIIGVRSFGADATKVSAHVEAWIRGAQSTGIAACAKHYPGHGDTAVDSHVARPSISASAAQLRARDLVPFTAAIDAGVATVMASHLLVSAFDSTNPASFSPVILGDLLRTELGFGGVIVSDALDMTSASGELGMPEAATRALAAGCDLLCLGPYNTDAQIDDILLHIDDAIKGGLLDHKRVEDASIRVAQLGSTLQDARANRPVPDSFTPGTVDGLDSATVATAFHISTAGQAFIDRHESDDDAHKRLLWVRLAPRATVTVGGSAWGPFDTVAPYATLGASHNPDIQFPPGARVVVVGKDNHLYPWAVAAIETIRSNASDILVVDMGWPAEHFAGVDIATFGSSRLVGKALVLAIG